MRLYAAGIDITLECVYLDQVFGNLRKSPAYNAEAWTSTRVFPSTSFYRWSLAVIMLQQIQENTENYPSSHDVAPYTAIDPFTPSIARSIANVTPSTYLPTIQPPITYQTFQATADGFTAVPTSRYVIAFLLDTLPRQIYLYFLLTLPSLYFSRVSRIFVEAELSKPIIERMIISSRVDDWSITRIQNTFNMTPLPFDSHVIASFKTSWEQFVDSMMKEWKTLNLVTVLLLRWAHCRLLCLRLIIW